MKISKKWLFYIPYTIATLIFFLYYLFPSDDIINFIKARVKAVDPDYDISIKKISPLIPPGIKMESVRLTKNGDLLLTTDSVKLKPGLGSIYGSNPVIYFRAELYKGTADGEIVLNRTKNKPTMLASGKARLKKIFLGEIKSLRQMTPYKIKGILGGNINWNLKGNTYDAKADLEAANFDIEINPPVFNLDRLTFDRIRAKLSAKAMRNLEIKECILSGNQIGGHISGNIILKKPGKKSILKLKGKFEPRPAFFSKMGRVASLIFKNKGKKGSFPFRLRGTLEKPSFSLR